MLGTELTVRARRDHQPLSPGRPRPVRCYLLSLLPSGFGCGPHPSRAEGLESRDLASDADRGEDPLDSGLSTGYILGCKFRITAKAHSSSSNKSSLSSGEVVHLGSDLSEAGQAIPEDLGRCSALLAGPPAPCRPVLHTPPGDPSNSTSARSRPPVAPLRRLGQALSRGRGCPQPCSALGPAMLVSPVPDAVASHPLHLYLSYRPSRPKSSPPPTDCPSVGDNVQHASHLISISFRMQAYAGLEASQVK